MRAALSAPVRALVGIALIALARHLAFAQTIDQFPVLPVGISDSIAPGPDSAMWFTIAPYNSGDQGRIGRVTTTSIFQYPITTQGSGPSGIVTGTDGNIWFADAGGSKVGRITPAGLVNEYDLAAGSFPQRIVVGPDGKLWFTESGRIGRIDAFGTLTEFAVPGSVGLFGIVAGPDGAVWFTDQIGRIGRVSVEGDVTTYDIPGGESRSLFGITVGPDGNLWFADAEFSGIGQIGRITSTGSMLSSFPLPSGQPFQLVLGPDGNVWFTYLAEPKVGRITTSGEVTDFPNAPIAAYSGNTAGIAVGVDGAIWYTQEVGGIGRISNLTCSQPAVPTISAPTQVHAGQTGIVASVVEHGGSSYSWEVTNGTIMGSANAASVIVTAGGAGEMTILATEVNAIGCYSPRAVAIVNVCPTTTAMGDSVCPSICVPSQTALCLSDNRFRVEAIYQGEAGANGVAQMVGLTADTGYMWFFDRSNIEAVLKVLNGCSVDSHFWVFAAGLTNVGVVITVTDTRTGQVNRYTNQLGRAFAPIQDTSAFAACQ